MLIYNMFHSGGNKSTLQWSQVLESCRRQSNGALTDEKEYRARLVMLSQILPEWLMLVTLPLPKGTLVKEKTNTLQMY